MYKLNILVLCCCFPSVIVFADKFGGYNNSYCIIRDPNFNIRYNFTKLTSPAKDITLTYDYPNETIQMQLCYPLTKKCNGKDGYGICLIKNKEERAIGKAPPNVTYKLGQTIFVFTGDYCTPQTKYNVTVLMKCDYAVGNNTYPELFPHTEEQCNLYMIWRTALACGPRIEHNCTVVDNGLHYDLSPLTRYSENYVIHMGNKTYPKIILNVCHSVIFEYNSLCELYSGACLQNSTETSEHKYINLGGVQSQQTPSIVDGHLQLEYQYGGFCYGTNVLTLHIKTTIIFVCDFEAIDTIPEYIKGSDECHYQLIWKTAAACSIESLRNHSASTAGKCTVTNPLTNFTYNLQPLMHKNFHTVTKAGVDYKFGVCGSATDTSCTSEAGACLMKYGISMGKANENLMWQEGGPYLNYTNGDHCINGYRYTVIAFVCGAEGSHKEPVIMEENPCQLIIHWNTDLVCEKKVKCATDDDEINLSSLIKSNENYIVKVNGIQFHINICRPLIPTPGLTCAHGSAICKTSLNSNNEFVNETSLGFPMENPIKISNNDRQVELHYLGGSPCPENSKKLLSSSFIFPCSYSNKGFPEYKGYEDCTYIFEWKTSITCGAVLGNWTSPCIIRDQLSQECDVSELYKEREIHRVKSEKGKDYDINICNEEKFCNGSAVCQGPNSYGSLANVIFDYSRDVIKHQYSNGDKCSNSPYSSEMRFICNASMGIGAPKLLWESQCSAEFEWQTNVSCFCRQTSNLPVNSGRHEILQNFSPSHIGTVAGVVLSVIALLATLFYFRDPNKRACLRSCWNSITSRRSGGRVQYCRVNTTEEVRLLLDVDPTQCQTDSDDDILNE